MSSSGNIFNVPEAKGRDLVGLDTTAATNAQVEAPTLSISPEVEANAGHVKDVARDASTAQSKGASRPGNTTSALDQLQHQASKTLNEAVAQGQHDVGAIKSASAEYVDQAKNLTSNAISTAQSYLPENVGEQTKNSNGNSGTGAVASLQSSAASALETTKGCLASAQDTVQPHIENAKGVAQGMDTHGKSMVASKDKVAASAPLQSIDGRTASTNKNFGPGIVGSLQSSAASALGTTKEYLASAQETAQPHIENAKSMAQGFLGGEPLVPSKDKSASIHGQTKRANGLQSGAASALETTKEYLAAAQDTAKPHIENAKGVVQSFLGTAGTQGMDAHGKPLALESEARTPYSSTMGTNSNVGQNKD